MSPENGLHNLFSGRCQLITCPKMFLEKPTLGYFKVLALSGNQSPGPLYIQQKAEQEYYFALDKYE